VNEIRFVRIPHKVPASYRCQFPVTLDMSRSLKNKSSAVAEMGDRLVIIDIDRKVGAAVPLSVGGAGSPSNNVAWAVAYLCTRWHLDPSNRFATIHQPYRQT